MKKLILIAPLILMAVITYSQTLNKGNIVSLHVYSLTLNQGVPYGQYLDFCKTKYIPAMEENFLGAKFYIVKGVKGECINCNGTILAWKTKTDMEKYFKPDGSATEMTKAANARLKPIEDELAKLAKSTNDKYTSWEIQ